MNPIISEKLKIYEDIRPRTAEFKTWENKSSLWLWLYTILKYRGVEPSKMEIVNILEGEIINDLPLELYSFVHRFSDVYTDMKLTLGMRSSLSLKLLDRWYGMLFEKEPPFYRSNNPVIHKWSYNPPYFRDVPMLLEAMFKNSSAKERGMDGILRAALMHNRIIEIYPYGEDTVTMAGMALLYCLMEAGIPIPSLSATEQEYNVHIADYLKTKDPSLFYSMLERSIINRLDVLIQICREAAEA